MPSAGARAASNMVKDLATLLATIVQRSIVERLDHISHSDQQEGCYSFIKHLKDINNRKKT